jgi:hypothetical protein
MLVKKGDILVRDGICYEVIVCDEQYFVVGEMRYLKKEGCIRTNFEHTQVYSNDESVNTLAQLHFAKRIKPEKWFD